MVANFTVTDMLGLPLDMPRYARTPVVISVRLAAATIPNGQEYTFLIPIQRLTPTIATTTQAGSDSGGVITPIGSGAGTYTYTYATKALANLRPDQHCRRSALWATRADLTDFIRGKQYSNSTFNFVPNGSPVTVRYATVNTASCNACHDPL